MKYRIQTNGEKFRVVTEDSYEDRYGTWTRKSHVIFDTHKEAVEFIGRLRRERTKQKRSETWTVVE